MELYAGLDLHTRNTYIGIMDNAIPDSGNAQRTLPSTRLWYYYS